MTGEWPTMTLREANVTLIDCDHRTPPAADTGYPYVAIPQLRDGRIRPERRAPNQARAFPWSGLGRQNRPRMT